MNADFTTLATVARCPVAAALRHVLGLRGETSKEALAGQIGHRVIERYFRGEPAEACLSELDAYDEYCRTNDVLPGEAWNAEDFRLILKGWMEHNRIDSFPITPALTELKFTVPLVEDGSYNLTGRIDLIGMFQGKLVACDHKFRSSTSDWWLKKFRMRAQLTGYAYALHCLYGAPISEVFINVVNVPRLPEASTRKCKTHKAYYHECRHLHVSHFLRPYLRSKAQIEPWRESVVHLMNELETIQQIVKGEHYELLPQTGSFNDSCTFCEFVQFCDMGCPWEDAGQLFAYDPWDPLA